MVRKQITATVVMASVACAGLLPGEVSGASGPPVDFERDVRSILVKHCHACHSAGKQESGLRLDRPAEAISGGDSGPVIVPGKVEKSSLIKRITSDDPSVRMPLQKTPLNADQIRVLSKWIAAGAEWPDGSASVTGPGSDHWSFQPIRQPRVPQVSRDDWVRNPIDAFVLARLEAAGITPSAEAVPATLVRRLHLDLTGLPPSLNSVDRPQGNTRPGDWERLVDRLLASPHFGERWGQHWLDLARYADSDGYEMDYARPDAWRWRDWAIHAINADMPFDQFTIEQLAGDLLPDATWQQRLATGFHRNTLTNTENGIDKEEFRVKAVVDRVNTTGTVWLGLTIGCAECHSHKYDPIRQREYYSLYAFFNNRVDEAAINVEPSVFDWPSFGARLIRHEREIERIRQQLQATTGDARRKLAERLAELRKLAPELRTIAAAFHQRSRPRVSHVHLRGNFLEHGSEVRPDVPAILPPLTRRDVSPPDRLDLAQWLVDPANPLTARVEANRIWQHLFGVGLVRTPEDFGTQGERPSHPELLDWLAAELVRRGWSRKAMIRLIVTSATYRQASAIRNDLARRDPRNRLFARQNRFRLDAEALRDQYLAASGLLNGQVGGPSFHPPLPAGMSQIGFKVTWKPGPVHEQHRRGMYITTRRNLAFPMLTTFDRPDANVTCTRRERSNTPLQSLTQMNDPLTLECSRALALHITGTSLGDASEKIDLALQLCLSRHARPTEVSSLLSLLQRVRSIYENDPDAAKILCEGADSQMRPAELAPWIVLARTIMNLDEFVTRE